MRGRGTDHKKHKKGLKRHRKSLQKIDFFALFESFLVLFVVRSLSVGKP
jgi:hypothetical protein